MKLLLLVLFFGFLASAQNPPSEDIPPSTCDFDINLDEYLSDICKQIKNKGGELFEKATEEAILFSEFYQKLRKFEDKFSDISGNNTYQNNDMWDARIKLYNDALLHECRQNKTIVEFYGCIKGKRENMITELDKLIAKNNG